MDLSLNEIKHIEKVKQFLEETIAQKKFQGEDVSKERAELADLLGMIGQLSSKKKEDP